MQTRLIFSALFMFLLIGCAQQKTMINPVLRIPFPEDEYMRLPSTGMATVKGQAFLKTRGGDVKTTAGNEIVLNPVTSYSDQWYKVAYLQNMPIQEPDPRLWEYTKKQVADADGRFTFKNVPAGDYYVTTGVFWEAPTGYQGALVKQGGIISKKITIKDNEEVETILTR